VLYRANDFPPHMVIVESNEIIHFYAGKGENMYYPYIGEVNYKNLMINIEPHEYIEGVKLSPFTRDTMLIEFIDAFGVHNDYKFIFLLNEGKLITDLIPFLNSHKTKGK
jgi:hypothetical protein